MATGVSKATGPGGPSGKLPAGNPKKKSSVFAMAVAAFLGTLSGSLPWMAALQGPISLILTFFRVPILCFLFFFTAIKFLTDRYLSESLMAWGLNFLTSPATVDWAQRITQAPVLCLMGLNRASICGATLFGLVAGTVLALLLATILRAARKKATPAP